MRIEWTDEFDRFLARTETAAEKGSPTANQQLDLIGAQLAYVRRLDAPPTEDTQTLKRIRQSKEHQLWRLSHPYVKDIAVRIVVWFPRDGVAIAVAVGGTDKAQRGDIWYDAVGSLSDQSIRAWKRTQQTE